MHTIPGYKMYHKSKHSSKQQLAGDVSTLTARLQYGDEHQLASRASRELAQELIELLAHKNIR